MPNGVLPNDTIHIPDFSRGRDKEDDVKFALCGFRVLLGDMNNWWYGTTDQINCDSCLKKGIKNGELVMQQVDGFEKNDAFSDYWHIYEKDPIQATFWGIDPSGGVYSMKHEGDAVDCATATDFIVFKADLGVPADVW